MPIVASILRQLKILKRNSRTQFNPCIPRYPRATERGEIKWENFMYFI